MDPNKDQTAAQPKSTFLVERSTAGKSKQFYTREEDEQIVKLLSAGKSIPEIAKAVGHPAASVTYRVTQKLSVMKSFGEYDYEKHRIKLSADEIKARKAEALAKIKSASVSSTAS